MIDLLSNAAIARCEKGERSDNEEMLSRADRKKRDKRKKALTAILQLIKRGSDVETETDVLKTIYEPISEQLELRAAMRLQWHARENDRVFRSMSADYKPIPPPFYFDANTPESKTDEAGISPLVGTPDGLMRLGSMLRKYGNAFVSCKASDLPIVKNHLINQRREENSKRSTEILVERHSTIKSNRIEEERKSMEEEKKLSSLSESNVPLSQYHLNPNREMKHAKTCKPMFSPSDHDEDETWEGWKSLRVGLEMQEPWGGLLLRGKKKIETRAYDLPKCLLGKRIVILQTKGRDGVSSLPNVIAKDDIIGTVERIGWCIFDRVIIYRYKSKFEADEPKHLVKSDSVYGWKDDTKIIYGWVVAKYGKFKTDKDDDETMLLVRRKRSLFEISCSK